MRHTAHDKGSIGALLVQWANSPNVDTPSLLVRTCDRPTYEAIRRAISRDHLPVAVKSLGGRIAIGTPEAVGSMNKRRASHIEALQRESEALQSLACLVSAMDPYADISEGFGAPESYSRLPKTTPREWRNRQPETTTLRIYNRPLESIPEQWKHRARWIPTEAELDNLQVPGI